MQSYKIIREDTEEREAKRLGHESRDRVKHTFKGTKIRMTNRETNLTDESIEEELNQCKN